MFNDASHVVITAVLILLASAVSYFLILEILRIVREFSAQMGGAQSAEPEPSPEVSAKQAAVRRNRATVERLINKFEERDVPPTSRPNE
jgi:hypothetical protein